jgi:parallel beta-helix repeat protein
MRWFWFFLCISLFSACAPVSREITLQHGMTIRKSCIIRTDTFLIPGADSIDQPVITIEGDNITVDFNGAILVGNENPSRPDRFQGLGILVKNGAGITLKNLTVRGFKVGLLAEGVDSLRIEKADFSYNYRQRLNSRREQEDPADWLSYHQNEQDEWLRYGAAIYLKNCAHALVRETMITGGQNGLMLTGCDQGLFYNNTIHFNSGVGIGLYRSSDNRILHNKLDWNVRGHSPGFYRRGQGSASILCYEQSHRNIFAHNSATHSGEGGCNDNLLFGNDFSYAPTNGSEVTFSRDDLADRLLVDRLPDGMETRLPETALKGTDYILMHEWGPYNFAYPSLWLRTVEGNRYTFLLLGPPGNWKLEGGSGWTFISQKTGTFPVTVVAEKEPGAQALTLDLTYLGPAFTDRFGQAVKKGTPYPFSFHRLASD